MPLKRFAGAPKPPSAGHRRFEGAGRNGLAQLLSFFSIGSLFFQFRLVSGVFYFKAGCGIGEIINSSLMLLDVVGQRLVFFQP